MIVSRLKRLSLLIYKTLSFYKKYGARSTHLEVKKRLKAAIQKKHSYDSLLNKFPQKFNLSRGVLSSAAQRVEIIDSSAYIALRELFMQLNLPVDAGNVLSESRAFFTEDRYYQTLEDLFAYEQFIKTSSNNAVYELIQTSELPKAADAVRRRNILFITAQFPNPHHGGGNRVLNFIKILSKNNNIYLSTCFNPDEDQEALQTLFPYCCSIQKIPYWKFGENQFEILEWLNGSTMDIVHYEWPRSLENYDPAYGRCQIFTYMEAVSLRLLMDMEHLKPLSEFWLDKFVELIHILHLELADTSRLNARIAVTTKDGRFFQGMYPYQEYAVLNHGITFDEFSLPEVEPEPHTLVFVGNYLHYPNAEALEFFFNEIWENIRKEIPDLHIYVVGANPTENLLRRSDGKHIVITGTVADVRPYIQKASVCIAPLISGAGLRGKVIEYAALRRPFVATSIAATDLVFKDGIDYFCANTATEFSDKIITLLKDPQLARRMADVAYLTGRQHYDNQHLIGFLLSLYEYLENCPDV